jgi:hypothetical protein
MTGLITHRGRGCARLGFTRSNHEGTCLTSPVIAPLPRTQAQGDSLDIVIRYGGQYVALVLNEFFIKRNFT